MEKIRLDYLKQKGKKRKDKVANNKMIEDRKRGLDANAQIKSVETTKIKKKRRRFMVFVC